MYLIAEIGFNHEGDMALAIDMIHAAAESGADAVKFQTFKAKDIALPSSPHYSLIEKSELSLDDHVELFNTSQKCGIDFLSTPFSRQSVDLLLKVGVSAFKVASMDCTNRPLLQYIAKTGKPIYLSTGMASLEEIATAINNLKKNKCKDISILHCISHYPAKVEELNLNIIPFLQRLFDVKVGYSDHYPGVEACFAVAVLGAQIIETHFTLDKTNPEGDHSHSADPSDLKRLRHQVDLFTTMAGSKEMIHNRPDRICAKDFRRGVYTTKALKKGDILTEEDLYCTRPPNDFTPNDIDYLKKKILVKDLPTNYPVSKNAIGPSSK